MSKEIIIYTDPLKPGSAQMPVYVQGDDQNWTLRFINGNTAYDPGNVTVRLGFNAGLPDGTYTNAFQWVDRLANQHIGSFSISSGVPGSLTWDENPIGVQGADGAYLLLGRTPPSSQIRKVNVVAGGSGLSTAPQLRFQGGTTQTGQGATATASITGNAVSSIAVKNVGKGYSSFPEIVITGDGTGALAHVSSLSNGQITNISIDAGGSGYSSATVTIVDPEASATASVGGSSAITGLTLLTPGSGFTSAPTVAITGGGGSSATATASLLNSTWGVAGLTLTNAGSGFTGPPTVVFSGGTGSGAAAVAEVSANGQLTSVTLTAQGDYLITNAADPNYPYDVVLTGGGGTGASVIAQFISLGSGHYGVGGVYGIQILNSGTGYTSAPTVSFVAKSGTVATVIVDAAATASVSSGPITSLRITNPGSGYGATAPTISFVGGGGTGATATAQLIGSPVGSLSLTNGGSSYTSAPAVGFSGGNGSGASAVAQVSLGITAVTMTKPGFAYTSQPSVCIVGTTSNGAIVEAAGVESYSVPYLRNFSPLSLAGGSVVAVPWTHNRRTTAGALVYDDSLLLIRPRTLLAPAFTLQADGVTWAAAFNPIVQFVQAVLNFRRSVSVDVEISGGGRLLYSGQLTIAREIP